MKNKFKWIGIALITAVLIFGFTGCPEDNNDGPAPSSAGALTHVYINGSDNTEEDIVGTKFTAAQYGTLTVSSSNTSLGRVIAKKTVDLSGPITLTVSGGASARFIVAGSTKPADAKFNTDGKSSGSTWSGIQSNGNHYLYVRLTAQSGAKSYYVLNIQVVGVIATIDNFLIGDVKAKDIGVGHATDWAQVEQGYIGLTSATSSGILKTENDNPREDVNRTKEYKLVAATDPAPTTFDPFPATAVSFAATDDGKIIYLKITSANGENTMLYKIEVQIGRIADLASMRIYSVNITDLGTPNSVASAAEKGVMEPRLAQEDDGYPITLTAVDEGAIIELGAGDETTEPSLYLNYKTLGNDKKILFADGDYLWIKVTSANGKNVLVYKLEVMIPQKGIMLYGQPKIKDAGNSNYIDSLFTHNDNVLLNVSRVNLNEIPRGDVATTGFFDTVDGSMGHTTATATTVWDDDALYVYVDVEFHDYYKDGVLKTRTFVPGTDHECDNVEIFLNERRQTYTSGFYGSQYRFGPQTDGTTYISGEVATAAGGDPDETVLPTYAANGEYNSWIKPGNAGYVVVAKVPYRFVGTAQTDELFNSTTGLVDDTRAGGAFLGFEIQLNTSSASGSRDAILTWNGVMGQSYRNVSNYGSAELKLGTGRVRGDTSVKAPVISTQPQSRSYVKAMLSDSAFSQPLSVIASASGIQSFQWYKNTTATTTGGTPVAGATNSTFQPLEADVSVGANYYYVIISNKRGTAAALTATSNVVTVTIIDRTVTPADQLLGTRGTINRAGKTVLFGTVFDDIAKSTAAAGAPYANDTFGKSATSINIGYNIGLDDQLVVWATNTNGGGQGLTINPTVTDPMNDPLSMYKLNFKGRTSFTSLPNGNFNGGSLGVINVASNGSFEVDAIVTAAQVAAGFTLNLNQWGGNSGQETSKVFSIDDLIIYKESAPEIDDFAIKLKAPVGGGTPVTSIDAAQFTGAVTWTPDPADTAGKFVQGTVYTASIVITAKAGYQAQTLPNNTVFTINGVNSAGYTQSTKTIVSAAFPGATPPPDAFAITSFDTTPPIVTTASNGTLTIDATGYNYVYGGAYDGQYAKVKVTIPAGFSLADYSSVSIKVTGVAGDTNYKNDVALLAAKTLSGGNHNSAFAVGKSAVRFESGTQVMVFVIDPAKAASLEGDIEIAFYAHAGDSGKTTEYRCEDIHFNP